MTGSFAVFVKTPGLSPIKTRLAAGIGKARAEDFHLASANAVAAVVKRASVCLDTEAYFAVAESQGLASIHWRALGQVYQGEGGLGERMRKVYSQLANDHGYAVLLGADSPQMSVEDLTAAADWLSRTEEPRFVLGPAADGGFWLFGGNRILPDTLWTSVEYSTPETGRHFTEAVNSHGSMLILRALRDVDRGADLPPLQAALASLSDPTPEQTELEKQLGGLQAAARIGPIRFTCDSHESRS